MREELHLENTELDCYAIIYSLSKGDNWFNAGVKNIMDALGKSEPCVINALKSLTKKELIVKVPVIVNNAKRHYYKATKTLDETTLNNLSNPTLNNLSPYIYKENNKEVNSKRLSNDNQKVPDDLFEKFWEAYDNKRGKEPAMKAWKRLTKEEKEAAIKRIPEYKEDCRLHERQMKYPATYLNQKTWQDDFDCDGRVKAEEHNTENEDRKLWEKQKEWLQKYLPNIAPEITQGVMKEFTNLAICDKHLLQDTLEELNKVYDGGDIVERFKEILNR